MLDLKRYLKSHLYLILFFWCGHSNHLRLSSSSCDYFFNIHQLFRDPFQSLVLTKPNWTCILMLRLLWNVIRKLATEASLHYDNIWKPRWLNFRGNYPKSSKLSVDWKEIVSREAEKQSIQFKEILVTTGTSQEEVQEKNGLVFTLSPAESTNKVGKVHSRYHLCKIASGTPR